MLSALTSQWVLRLSSICCQETLAITAARCITTSTALWRNQALLPPPERPLNAPTQSSRPDLVQQYLSPTNFSKPEQRQLRKVLLQQQFSRFPGDTGSTEVQVAILTDRIYDMNQHMKENKKDFSSRRGLEGMLSSRRRLLQYLRRTDFPRYATLIARLGLRDTFIKKDRLTLRTEQRHARAQLPTQKKKHAKK